MQKVSEKESKDYKDEIWKEIPNTNGIYFISNYGRLKSFRRDKEKGRIMKLSKVKQFHTANVKINGRYKSCLIHKLVAELFIPKPDKTYKYIEHIDGNIENNHVSNLKWISKEENYMRVIEKLSSAKWFSPL